MDTLGSRLEKWFMEPAQVRVGVGASERWVREPATLEGFLVSEDLTGEEFRGMMARDEGLRRSFERARMAAKDLAVRCGLVGEWSSGVWSYYMTNEHGYKSRSEAVVEHREGLSVEERKILEMVGVKVLDGE